MTSSTDFVEDLFFPFGYLPHSSCAIRKPSLVQMLYHSNTIAHFCFISNLVGESRAIPQDKGCNPFTRSARLQNRQKENPKIREFLPFQNRGIWAIIVFLESHLEEDWRETHE